MALGEVGGEHDWGCRSAASPSRRSTRPAGSWPRTTPPLARVVGVDRGLQGGLTDPLELLVQRQGEVVPGHRRGLRDLARGLAERVDLDRLGAVGPAQEVVIGGLEAGLPDDRVGRNPPVGLRA